MVMQVVAMPFISGICTRDLENCETAKTWGPFDGRGQAMFGWRMDEEAEIQFTITVNRQREDGSITTTQLGTLDSGDCRSAEDVGLQLADAKRIPGRVQEIVVNEQLQRHCELCARVPTVFVGAT
jgi:hypothetical protein